MIVSLVRPIRPYADLADITTKQILTRGWVQQVSGDETYDVQFAVNLTDAERDAVVRRLTTATAVEETLYTRGAAALDVDRNFRDTVTPQLLAGAQAIIDDPAITQAEAVAYVRDLARAVRALANQTQALAAQNIGLIRLAQRLLDTAD